MGSGSGPADSRRKSEFNQRSKSRSAILPVPSYQVLARKWRPRNFASLVGMLIGGAWADRWSPTNERARILVPVSTGNSVGDLALYLAAVLAIAVVIGLVESSMARLRFIRVPQLLVTATLLAGFAVVLLLR